MPGATGDKSLTEVDLFSFRPGFLKQLEQLKVHTRRSFLGSRQGIHTSRRRGHGLEFADYRPYSPGDDFRTIDWNVLGKTDRVYIREYREEQDLNILFLLDASASMRFPKDDSKLLYAQRLLLALSYAALSNGDTVAISILGGATSPRYRSLKAISRELEFLTANPAAEWESLTSAVQLGVSRMRFPGKCFLISDCLYEPQELASAVDFIRSRNFEVSLLQVLAPSEIELKLPSGSFSARDNEQKKSISLALDQRSAEEYRKLLGEHLAAIENYALRSGVSSLTLSSADDLEEVILSRLPAMGILK